MNTDLASAIADRVFHYTRNCRCGSCHKQQVECSECETCRIVILKILQQVIANYKERAVVA